MKAVENELHAVMLNLVDIVLSDVKIREVDKNAKEWPGFLKSIIARGILSPIQVRQIVDPETTKVIPGKYEVIEGGHRVEGAKDAKLSKIPAIIFTDVSDDELIARQAISNMHRFPQKPSQILHQIKLCSQRHQDWTQGEVACFFDMSDVKLGQMLKLSNLTEPASKLVDAGTITLSNSFQLARLDPLDQTKDILGDATNMNIEDFSAVVKRIKSDRTAERRGLPKKEGFDPQLMKKKDIENYWAEKVHDLETTDPEDDSYVFKSAQKLTLDHLFQVDAESVACRQAEKDAKKAVKTLDDQQKMINKKKEELDQLNKDLAEAKANKQPEVVGV